MVTEPAGHLLCKVVTNEAGAVLHEPAGLRAKLRGLCLNELGRVLDGGFRTPSG